MCYIGLSLQKRRSVIDSLKRLLYNNQFTFEDCSAGEYPVYRYRVYSV